MTRRAVVVGAAAVAALAALALALGERKAAASGRWLREAGLQETRLSAGGLELRLVRAGSGPTLVLLHGFAASIYSWSAVLPELARDHDVIALDFPGFGGSAQPPDLQISQLPPTVLAVMDGLGVERASLIGNSLGGAVAVAVAARSPGRVERLVLIDSAGFNLAQKDRPGLLRLIGALPLPLLERLPVRRALTRAGLRQVFFDQGLVTDERVEEYLAPLQRPGSLRALKSLLGSRSEEGDSFPELARRVGARTLILWGREDRWVPVAQADLFASAIAGSRTVVLARCGHLPQEERPAETAALIRSFLKAP